MKTDIQKMKLIEILTAPYNLRCECLGCLTPYYNGVHQYVKGRENESIKLLNDNQLSNLLKNGTTTVDYHAKARFAILMNLVSDPIEKINVTKKLILDSNFELAFLDLTIINGYNNLANLEKQINTSLELFSYVTLIKHALVYRAIPELLENNILNFPSEKIVLLAKQIASFGYKHYTDFFCGFHPKDQIQLITILYDQYIKTNHQNLIKPIHELFELIHNQQNENIPQNIKSSYIELANRILSTGNHEYLPFKTTNYGAKNLDEYMQIVEKNKHVNERIGQMKKQQNQKIEAVYTELNHHVKQIQLLEEKVERLQKQLDENIKFDKRMRHLNQLCDLTPVERLKFIIQSEFTIYYYPNFLFENIMGDVDRLPSEYKLKLLDKLQIVNRGPLKDLKIYLTQDQSNW